jgi:hypothetical protein
VVPLLTLFPSLISANHSRRTYNTDGIATGANGHITRSYIRSNDDSLKLYSPGTACVLDQSGLPLEVVIQLHFSLAPASDQVLNRCFSGMVIEDCVVWQMQNGGVFQLGWWTNSTRTNITVSTT